jgi:hypothetical protein
LDGKPTVHYSSSARTKETFDGPGFGSELLEYRIDWSPAFVRFYVGGKLQQEFTSEFSVPIRAGYFLWENWSNGYPEYSAGPPLEDSVMKIRSIDMYWNATDGETSCRAPFGIGLD